MATPTLTDDGLTAALKANQLLCVFFTAPWCGPCKEVVPIWDHFAERNPDVVIATANIDDCPNAAAQWTITEVPRLILFEDGQPQWSEVGASVTYPELQDLLDRLRNGPE